MPGSPGSTAIPSVPPRVGFAWLDPMCGLMLAFIVAAALWQRRRSGAVARIDFSMIEAMLWTMAEPLLATQLGAPPQPRGNAGDNCVPHGVYRCAGEDDWLALPATGDDEWRALCALVPPLTPFAEWELAERRERSRSIRVALAALLSPQRAADAARRLRDAGVPAAALASSLDLVSDPHLCARGFWDPYNGSVIPGLPWRASFGRTDGPPPGLGADTEAVLRDVASYTAADIGALRAAGAFG